MIWNLVLSKRVLIDYNDNNEKILMSSAIVTNQGAWHRQYVSMWHGTEVFAAMCHQKCLIQCFPKPAFRMLGCCHMKGSTGRVTSQYDSVHLLLPEKTNLRGIRTNHLGISLSISPFVTSKQAPIFQPPRLSWKSLEPTYRPSRIDPVSS